MSLTLLMTSGMPFGTLPVDPSAVFEPGMIGGLIDIGGVTMVTVSDGVSIPPFGIIDDINTSAFRRPVIDDTVIIPSPGVQTGYGGYVSPVPVQGILRETNIIPESFAGDLPVKINAQHGTVVIPAGTQLNHKNSNGEYDGFELICSYQYMVPDMPGDSSVAATGLITLHLFRGMFSTDMFDTTVDYLLNAPIYTGQDGKITTKVNGPIVGMVIGTPSTLQGELTFLWL